MPSISYIIPIYFFRTNSITYNKILWCVFFNNFKQAAEDALKYTDLVAAGRAQIIDANFARKVVTGEGSIISEITEEEELQQKFTPGLREVFDKETKRPNFAKKAFGELDYDKALKY